MPIYEYQCQTCGHELESIQRISDAPLTKCPECEKDSLIKQISAAGFRLSGSGWYETDFKSKKDQKNLTSKDGANGDKGASPACGDKGASPASGTTDCSSS